MSQWWHDHGRFWTVVTIALSVGGVALLPVLVVRLPHDYFVRTEPSPTHGPAANLPLARLASLVLKNAIGAAIFLLGVGMSLPLVPGPGLLAMVVGLSLMSFPGKRRLELGLVKLPRVLAAINATRQRFGHAPLVLF